MDTGIRTITSRYSVDETVTRIQSLLEQRGIKLFALIDHSGEARAAGLDMRPTKLLIFGNPKAGTPLMISAPGTALDLPLKILIAQDPDGTTVLSWNDSAWLQRRHGFASELTTNLAAAENIAKKAAE